MKAGLKQEYTRGVTISGTSKSVQMVLRTQGGVGIPEFEIYVSKRLSGQWSVYTAEMVAVIISLQ